MCIKYVKMGKSMENLRIIENYIVYLITECELSVTIHPMEEESLITFSRLIRFNIHDNSYCASVKASPEGYRRCLEQQRRVHGKCQETGESFCGFCHAGVLEYVYPFTDGKRTIGFISVSGYCGEHGREGVNGAAVLLGVPKEQLLKNYSTLRHTLPDKARLDTLILPLCKMIELAYLTESGGEREDSFIRGICRFIHQNYATDLTTEDICGKFYCSRSHFSHSFKRETGKSFREYLIEIRLSHAKRLLRYSTLSIGEIAFSVGFSDANYFSSVFKRAVGISPAAYRRK